MMVKKLSYFLLAINWILTLSAQEWTFIQKQDVGQNITASDIGALGKLYVGTERGNVYSFQADGTPDAQFSSAIFLPVTDVDASNSLRIFVFYKDANQFEYLERFTAQPRTYQLEDFGIDHAEHAALDEDGTIWFLNGLIMTHVFITNHSTLSTQTLPSRVQLDSISDLAYDQRIIFSNTQSGFSYWDGNKISSEERPSVGVESFDIYSGELVALSDQGVLISDQSNDQKKLIEPPRHDFTNALKTGSVFHFIRGSEIYSFKLNE
ncbi:MAG: hypothetical protein GY816_13425 [Cytophagales bacterium]|nr:hypothetical protein [Cytophagales bacterium]